MDYSKALTLMAEHLKDKENGVEISETAEALIMFSLLYVEAYDDAEYIAGQQAEWEFNNNADVPHARLSCEKLERAYALKAARCRDERNTAIRSCE